MSTSSSPRGAQRQCLYIAESYSLPIKALHFYRHPLTILSERVEALLHEERRVEDDESKTQWQDIVTRPYL